MYFLSSVVRCRHLTKTFGDGPAAVRALRGVDLDVKSGEVLMIMGPSGCGKTTLLSVISTLLDSDAGLCEVLGRDLTRMTAQERSSFRCTTVGFVFQRFNLLPGVSVLDNVTVPLLISGHSRKGAEGRAFKILDELGLRDRTSASPNELSGGQQQRVAIARALVHNPRLIVCDEPTSALDQTMGQTVMETLRSQARQTDRAVIVVTHDTRIMTYADRVTQMEDGAIIGRNNAIELEMTT
ncbi:ABC transporter ATP-binding protein [Afipia felis]|nr:ABC transporter ATP-binding protein [Afipia felis]